MGRRRAVINPGMRISDADRAEMADHLSKQYGEGRLDQSEFNERLDRAMRAKTQSDLTGLLIAVVALVFFTWQALVRPYLPWVLVALLAYLLWLRHGPERRS